LCDVVHDLFSGLEDAAFAVERLPDLKREPCTGVAIDAYSAAKIVHERLLRFMAGQHKAVIGLTASAPTEYLGLLGLSEALLYCLRLYEVVLSAGVQAAAATDIEQPDLIEHSVLNKERIEFVLSTLGQGYTSDPLLRALPDWLALLADSEMAAKHVVAKSRRVSPADVTGCEPGSSTPQLSSLVTYFGTDKPAASDAAVGSLPAYFTLHNGVAMPSVGLGTWLLQGEVCYDSVLQAIKLGYR
jgi:hypothetical protein